MTTKIPAELSSTPGIIDSSNATAITIDSSEEVGIGSTSPSAKLEVLSSSNSTYFKAGGDDSGTNARALTFTSASGTSLAGAVHIINAPSIQGQIAFQTNNGERARITGNGITFNGDTAAANALDDYEEGTWTPVYQSTTNSSNNVNNSRVGYYTKIGNTVYITATLFSNDLSGITSTDQVVIGGLPYASSSTTSGNDQAVNVAQYRFLLTTDHTLLIQNNSSDIRVTTDGFSAATYATFFQYPGSTSTSLKISAVYQV